MKKPALIIGAAGVVGLAMAMALSGPAYACAGKVAQGFPNAAFQNSGVGSFSLGGEADSTPRLGFGGGFAIGSDAGAHTDDNSVVRQRPQDAAAGQSLVDIADKCPDLPD